MKRFSLRYTLLTSRFDQLWFPLAFWLLFVIIGIIRGPEYILDTSRAYLGAVLPLVGGIMAAYAVLDDPSLELRFATPIPASQTLLERISPTFIIQVLCALTYQVFAFALGADFAPMFGNWFYVQAVWLVPTLSLMALGCLTAFIAAQTTTGAVLVGLVWIVQLVARGDPDPPVAHMQPDGATRSPGAMLAGLHVVGTDSEDGCGGHFVAPEVRCGDCSLGPGSRSQQNQTPSI